MCVLHCLYVTAYKFPHPSDKDILSCPRGVLIGRVSLYIHIHVLFLCGGLRALLLSVHCRSFGLNSLEETTLKKCMTMCWRSEWCHVPSLLLTATYHSFVVTSLPLLVIIFPSPFSWLFFTLLHFLVSVLPPLPLSLRTHYRHQQRWWSAYLLFYVRDDQYSIFDGSFYMYVCVKIRHSSF